MTDRRTVAVPEGLDGLRLDTAVARLFGLSRAAAADIVGSGDALLDGTAGKGSDPVRGGAWLDVALPPPRRPVPDAQPVAGLRVLHQDDHVLVVDKPAGVAAHPSPGYTGPTVVSGLLAGGHQLSGHGPAERQGLVHRLDAGTSGLMVVAKSDLAYSRLKDDFRERRVDKGYDALVQGHPDPSRGTIDAPIDRHPSHPYRFAVVAGGRPSVTHYEVAEAFRAASLVSVRLETGRTHQIRVHFSALRHPCVGDLQYGADPTLSARLGLDRQWLHAARLAFRHPVSEAQMAFESRWPVELAAAVHTLRAES